MGFIERIKTHEAYQKKVIETLQEHGVSCVPFGVERGIPKEFHKKLLSCKDFCAKFVRFLPDKVAVKEDNSFLVEIKSELEKKNRRRTFPTNLPRTKLA